MGYVIVGGNVFDSKEILESIEKEFGFKDIKDLTSGSKRDDTLVYQVVLDANVLKAEIEEEMDIKGIEKSEMIEELLNSSDEHVMLIEDTIPDDFIGYAYTYKYDEDMEILKSIFVGIDNNLGELKLKDIAERILKSVD